MGGRVRFLQSCGRVMRPSNGKRYGIIIDHAGAVFRHGFPDEDTEWTLEGSVDDAFRVKKREGKTATGLYCAHCDLVYHGGDTCPLCGRLPKTPPKSVFDPPPMDSRNELLTEAEREKQDGHFSRKAKVIHWLICLQAAKKRQGSYGMAAQIYKRKYHEWPGDDFPRVPTGRGWREKVTDAKIKE
jgi:superfamily II DNA or RNA helicase